MWPWEQNWIQADYTEKKSQLTESSNNSNNKY